MVTSTLVDICPACLVELPAGYTGDHVVVDRVLSGGGRELFAAMTDTERCEVLLTGLARRATMADLARLLNWPDHRLRELLPDDHPESAVAQVAALECQVRELWARGVSDTVIAARTGWGPSKIGRIRRRLGLPGVPRTCRKWGAR